MPRLTWGLSAISTAGSGYSTSELASVSQMRWSCIWSALKTAFNSLLKRFDDFFRRFSLSENVPLQKRVIRL